MSKRKTEKIKANLLFFSFYLSCVSLQFMRTNFANDLHNLYWWMDIHGSGCELSTNIRMFKSKNVFSGEPHLRFRQAKQTVSNVFRRKIHKLVMTARCLLVVVRVQFIHLAHLIEISFWARFGIHTGIYILRIPSNNHSSIQCSNARADSKISTVTIICHVVFVLCARRAQTILAYDDWRVSNPILRNSLRLLHKSPNNMKCSRIRTTFGLFYFPADTFPNVMPLPEVVSHVHANADLFFSRHFTVCVAQNGLSTCDVNCAWLRLYTSAGT